VSNLVRQRNSLMFRPRSYMAFVTTPQPPIVDWLSGSTPVCRAPRAFLPVSTWRSIYQRQPQLECHRLARRQSRGARFQCWIASDAQQPPERPARAYFDAARGIKGEQILMLIPDETRGFFNKLFSRKAA
jgi:hypothetical protein